MNVTINQDFNGSKYSKNVVIENLTAINDIGGASLSVKIIIYATFSFDENGRALSFALFMI